MNLEIFSKLFTISILMLFITSFGYSQRATVTVHQDSKITELLNLKKELEKENKLTDGFTIQLYYGELNQANQMLRKYRGNHSSWPGSIEYETPNYKVWVGNYTTRLDAERALLEIHTTFPAAFILKPERRK